MKQLIEELEHKMIAFYTNAIVQVEKGNDSAGLHARCLSHDLESLLKRFRKLSRAASENKKYKGKESV